MRTLMIVHFQPLEKYPPVINFIRFAAERQDDSLSFQVITTHPGKEKAIIDFPGAHINRLVTWKKSSRISRLVFYMMFNVKSLWALIKARPSRILYYETLSSFGPWFYTTFINKKAKVFIHYHEYTTQEEYASGMMLCRWLHKYEKKLYPSATWISHTNQDRMQFFLKDLNSSIPFGTYIMPNYPSATWYKKAEKVSRNSDPRIGFVYVGALSINNMHTREMANFVASHKNECYWHIYSDNHDTEALDFLRSLKADNIAFKGGVLYDDLPTILPAYDIGVILYTGNTPNYAYNAPNKFFEYVSCGLNIWYPKGMKGLHAYEQPTVKPWVRCVDFNELTLPPQGEALRTNSLEPQRFTAERVYDTLWKCIISDTK
jgi:hypothetical protein